MKYFNLDIQSASWLELEEKNQLIKAFDAVRMKDVQEQGIEQLCLDVDKAYHYRQAMIGVLRALSAPGVIDILGAERIKEIGDHIENLISFFEVLDCDDMKTLLLIKDVYDYGEDVHKSRLRERLGSLSKNHK